MIARFCGYRRCLVCGDYSQRGVDHMDISRVADRWVAKTAYGCDLVYVIKGFGGEVEVFFRGISTDALSLERGLESAPKDMCADVEEACTRLSSRANICEVQVRRFVKHIATMCRGPWGLSFQMDSEGTPVYCPSANSVVYGHKMKISEIADNKNFREAFEEEARNYSFSSSTKAIH